MKLAEIDWGVLRGSLVFFVCSLLVSAGLFTGAYYLGEDVELAHERQRRQLHSVRSQYQSLDDEQRLIEVYLPRFDTLAQRGIVGEERRLDWIEALRGAAARIKLPALRYNISEQDIYVPDFPVAKGKFDVYASDMRLDVGLLHEGDLPDLLDSLDRRADGFYSVAGCSIQRTVPEFRLAPDARNLSADCRLRWLTIRLPAKG